VGEIASRQSGIRITLKFQWHHAYRAGNGKIGDLAVGISAIGEDGICLTGGTYGRNPIINSINTNFAVRRLGWLGITARLTAASILRGRRRGGAFRFCRSEKANERQKGG
jgi:hypothetical protein